MTVTLGSLTLGKVQEVTPAYVSRIGDVDLPLARGVSKQFLGSQATAIGLKGYLSGSTRYDDLRQMDRIRMIGGSLKLASDPVTTIVFIRSVKPDDIGPSSINYSLALEESLFTEGHDCDSVADWSVDSGGGALTAATSTPTPLEGAACIKLSGTIAAATASRMKCTPTDAVDLSLSTWVAFWFITDNVTDLTSAYAKFYHDASNYVSYDFSAQLTEAGKWVRVLIPKSAFSETGAMEWDLVTYFTVDTTHSTQQTYYIAVDDVGGYE